MKRLVQPEWLDSLPADDPPAVRSRHDLLRINAWMRNPDMMARALKINWNRTIPLQITELGAGDGKFLLAVAQKIAQHGPDVQATLLDRQKIVSAETLAAFAKCGWRADAVVADVFNWPSHPAVAPDFSLASARSGGKRELGTVSGCALSWPQADDNIVIANLFLHHFEDARLAELFRLVFRRAGLFIAIEPRRGMWPLFCSRLLWAIGSNNITRHDAVVSVRAGFSSKELSSLWPDKSNWQLTEQFAGAFSHLFIARKIS